MELAPGDKDRGDSWAVVKSFIDFISKTHIAPLCLFQSFKELINRPMSPPGKPSLWRSNEVKPRSKKVARPEPRLHSISEGQRLSPPPSSQLRFRAGLGNLLNFLRLPQCCRPTAKTGTLEEVQTPWLCSRSTVMAHSGLKLESSPDQSCPHWSAAESSRSLPPCPTH